MKSSALVRPVIGLAMGLMGILNKRLVVMRAAPIKDPEARLTKDTKPGIAGTNRTGRAMPCLDAARSPDKRSAIRDRPRDRRRPRISRPKTVAKSGLQVRGKNPSAALTRRGGGVP